MHAEYALASAAFDVPFGELVVVVELEVVVSCATPFDDGLPPQEAARRPRPATAAAAARRAVMVVICIRQG
jgi:hypothetical protein